MDPALPGAADLELAPDLAPLKELDFYGESDAHYLPPSPLDNDRLILPKQIKQKVSLKRDRYSRQEKINIAERVSFCRHISDDDKIKIANKYIEQISEHNSFRTNTKKSNDSKETEE